MSSLINKDSTGTEKDIVLSPFGTLTSSTSINGIPFPEMTNLEETIPVKLDIIHQFMALELSKCITMKSCDLNVISMYLARGRDEELEKQLMSLLEIYKAGPQNIDVHSVLEASIMSHITKKMNGY
jgi:hypothetical protein